MASQWTGDIVYDDQLIHGITLSSIAQDVAQSPIPKPATLRFLSIVTLAHIPLYLAVGPQYAVTTDHDQTERWFARFLLGSHDLNTNRGPQWWQLACLESPLGILVSVTAPDGVARSPRVTELLFFASSSANYLDRASTPPPQHAKVLDNHESSHSLQVYAMALSSDLISAPSELSPPASPCQNEVSNEGVFLRSSGSSHDEVIDEPPVRKRKTIDDAFDKATERRRKARRRGGEGVAAAGTTKTDGPAPSLQHRRSVSGAGPQPGQAYSRPLSRSPSVSSSRPGTARVQSDAQKRSALSRVQSLSNLPEPSGTETKNKDLISRIVMAGMRLHGLVQSRSRKSRGNSTVASPMAETSFEQLEVERQQDDEYKLVYHQVFKGVCFAFRAHMSTSPLQSRTEAVREITDKLLAVFCNDPLQAGLPSLADSITPGGRKAFGLAGQEILTQPT